MAFPWPAATNGRPRRGRAPAITQDVTLQGAFGRLAASSGGLTTIEAQGRLIEHGANRLRDDDGNHPLAVLFRQFRSPMVLILLGAAVLSYLLGQTDEASIVVFIVIASTGLGFYQEYRAGNAVAELRRRIAVSSHVWRDSRDTDIPSSEIVPGDVVLLRAGSLVPADGIVLDADALHVDEAALTGESFPVVKAAASPNVELRPDNRVSMGTSVRSGDARMLVTETGTRTEFGSLAMSLASSADETSFATGTRRFGLLMTQIVFVLVTVVLVANVLLGRPVLDSLLFAAALAVGMTPELLPAIVTVTLSQGAKRLTEKGVLVRRLVAIENLGAMDVLCTDKTGTLTVGEVRLEGTVNADGVDSAEVLRLAVLNSALQTALPNPLDTAICERRQEVEIAAFVKRGEVPYDFERKRLSVLVDGPTGRQLICKGAATPLLAACPTISAGGQLMPLDSARRAEAEARFAAWSSEGKRVIAVATKSLPADHACSPADETDMTLVGYLLFSDPLKPGIAQTVADLARNGIGLRIISGDSRYVAGHVATLIGLPSDVLAGEDLVGLSDEAFARKIADVNVFAETTPDQKERIISALRRSGRTVGYMGDGINDAPALRAADIGISVDNAVDAAKASADVILLQQDLEVLLDGILAGRTAFGNTIKYLTISISANFGNMLSMAAASFFLPFLPMLAPQILINNLLADFPMLAVSTDRVDPEILGQPRHWNFRDLVRTMLVFGPLSSLFDAVTFTTLLFVFHANEATFHTAWFVESMLTQLVVVAVMRTRRAFYASKPSSLLVALSTLVAGIALLLPFTPAAAYLAFVPPSWAALGNIAGIVVAYVGAAELLKRWLNRAAPAVPAHSTAA